MLVDYYTCEKIVEASGHLLRHSFQKHANATFKEAVTGKNHTIYSLSLILVFYPHDEHVVCSCVAGCLKRCQSNFAAQKTIWQRFAIGKRGSACIDRLIYPKNDSNPWVRLCISLVVCCMIPVLVSCHDCLRGT